MTQNDAIAEARGLFESLIKRVAEEFKGLDGPLLVWTADPSQWSILQIADHLVVIQRAYLAKMQSAIAVAGTGQDDEAYSPTWLGRTLRKAAGPGGNAPAPKMFHPRKNPPPDVFDELIHQWREMIAFCDASAGKAVMRPTISTPMSPVPKMSVVDALLLHADHGLRHVNQMGDRKAAQAVPA
jgi:hypothetical protein